MRLKFIATALFVVALLCGFSIVESSADVGSRISSAVEWLRGQEVTDLLVRGFARGTDSVSGSILYVEDNALVVLALSDYQATHNTEQYDDLLKVAVRFVRSARTLGGDFYEYYDVDKGRWSRAGGLYSWDAYAIAALATAAYKISAETWGDRNFWSQIEAQLKRSMLSLLSYQQSDGAWLFQIPGTVGREALVRENALLLAGLSYLALFEYLWGSRQQARFYAELSERTAAWVFSMQDTNATSPLFGGFPHSQANSTQVSEENGTILFGVNSYYSIIGLLDSEASPSVWDARRVMEDWVRGFVRKMRDPYGGEYSARTVESVVEYPKTTRAMAWILQALADIWVNIGGDEYYGDSQRPYDWIVGGNELSADLQGAVNLSGATGGFYGAITGSGLDKTARTDIAASTLFAFNRGSFILVPEFPDGAGVAVFSLFVAALILMVKSIPARLNFVNSLSPDSCPGESGGLFGGSGGNRNIPVVRISWFKMALF